MKWVASGVGLPVGGPQSGVDFRLPPSRVCPAPQVGGLRRGVAYQRASVRRRHSTSALLPTFIHPSHTHFPLTLVSKSRQPFSPYHHLHGNFHPDTRCHLHSFLGFDGKIPLWHHVSTIFSTWVLSQSRYLVYHSIHYPFHSFRRRSLGKTVFINHDHYLYDLFPGGASLGFPVFLPVPLVSSEVLWARLRIQTLTFRQPHSLSTFLTSTFFTRRLLSNSIWSWA